MIEILADVGWALVAVGIVGYMWLGNRLNKDVLPYLFAFLLCALLILGLMLRPGLPFDPYVLSGVFALAILVILAHPLSIRRYVRLLKSYTNFQEQGFRWLSMSQQAFEGIFHVDAKTYRYLDANPSGLKALGYTLDELRQLTIEDIHPDCHELLKRKIASVINEKKTSRLQIWATTKQGKRIYVDLSLAVYRKNGHPVILSTARDLTRWIARNEQFAQLTAFYEILSSSNRAITQIRDERKLLERIVDIVTDEGKFKTAWVAELEESKVKPVYVSGADLSFISALDLDLKNPKTRPFPAIQAFRMASVVCANHILQDDAYQCVHDQMARAGVGSIAALPIRFEGEVPFVIVIYSQNEFSFDEKTQALLKTLSDDLSRALEMIEVERQRRNHELQLRKLSSAVDQSTDAIAILSSDGSIEYVNAKYEQLTGYLQADLIGKAPWYLCFDEAEAEKYQGIIKDLANGRQWKGEVHMRRKDGVDYWSREVITPIRNNQGEIVNYVSSSEDWTALRQAQEKIAELAFYDVTTGLPNKRLLLDRLAQAVKACVGKPWHVAVLFVDLDRFKHLNDLMGRRAGDEALRQIAGRLQSVVGSDDTVARLSADEYVVVLSRVFRVQDIVHTAELIQEVVSAPIDLDGEPLSLTASTGVSVAPADGVDPDELIRKADLAMYHAKSTGRANFQFYTEEMNARAVSQLELERQLRIAVSDMMFELWYQPQINFATGEVEGVEALLRWPGPKGMISPAEFIPLAESLGFMPQIGEWVTSRACQDIARFNAEHNVSLRVAVNLSASQFRQSDCLVEEVRNALSQSGLPPELLEIELTESLLVDDMVSASETLDQLRASGASLAIDDFGTGYSSLSYLTKLPVDKLKIDRSFVQGLDRTPDGEAVVTTIITLGHQLKMKVLAEGVETEEHFNRLKALGCDSYQGYLFSPPVPLAKLHELFFRGVSREGQVHPPWTG